jgi:hypothetical protein
MYPKKKANKESAYLLLIATFFLITAATFAFPFTSLSLHATSLGFVSNSASSNITMLGADGVGGGGLVTQSFLDSLYSQGLKWDRECLCLLTSTALTNLNSAGINTIGMISDSPAPPSTAGNCSTDTLLPESSYKATIQGDINSFPSIHYWEYGNEPQGNWCEITPQYYFDGLVWAYQVITSTPGHGSDIIQGPTETIWTGNAESARSCYDSDSLSWFQTLWSLSDPSTGLTPAKILTYVSLHVYTQGQQWDYRITSGQCAGQTIAAMISNGLTAYYNAEGRSKGIVISETGFPSGNTTTSYNAQATWYQQMVPFFDSLGFVKGVFAYELHDDNQLTFWGLFTSDLQPKPSWSVYQGFLSGATQSITSTTSSISTNPTSTSVTSTSTSSSFTSQAESSSTSAIASGSIKTSASQTKSFLSTRSDSRLVSHPGQTLGIFSLFSLFNDPTITYALAVSPLCLIGALVFVVTRSRKRGIYNVNNQGRNWWYSIPNAISRWIGIDYLLPHSPWQFGFYENAATSGINIEGSILVHKRRKVSANKQQGKLASGKRGPRGIKAGEVSKNIVKHVASKNGYARKAKKNTTKKVKE